jgi:hypothetical protein
MMKKLWLLIGIVICVFALTGVAEEHHEHDDDHGEEREVFDRNIRLDFRSVPQDEGDPGIFILTATPEFVTHVRAEGDGGEIVFEVFGEIELMDDGKFFVQFECHTFMHHKEGEAEFNVETGVILTPGKEVGVSRLGDKTLMIKASYEDDSSPEKGEDH